MNPRIGAYARISIDADGEALGVARQHTDSLLVAQRNQWSVTRTYTDNGISAYRRGVVRPDFERLLTDLTSGAIDGVVAYDLDRLWRQPSDLERIIAIFEQRPTLRFATVQGDIDLSNSEGRTMARIMVAIANKSSSDTSRRVKRKIQEQAELGRPHGRTQYGYLPDRMTLDPVESKVVRQMGQWLIDGYSYREITWRLNEQGIRTRAGSLWYVGTIRTFLSRSHYAGIRTHDGIEYKGQWEPVFTPDEWETLTHTVRARKDNYAGRPQSKKYLLTGLVECGGEGCGGYLHGMTKRDNPNRPLRRTYQCAVQSENERHTTTCGGTCVGSDPLDHFIREAVCFRLDTADLATLLGSDDQAAVLRELLAQTAQLNARRDALVDDYADGTLDKQAYTRANNRVKEQLKETDKKIDSIRRSQFNMSLDPGQTVRDAWIARPDGWRRELAETLIEKIVVSPNRKIPYYTMDDGVRVRFNPDRVEIKWKV